MMELVAMDLKQSGFFLARTLSSEVGSTSSLLPLHWITDRILLLNRLLSGRYTYSQ